MTCQEGVEGLLKYSTALSSTLALDRGGWSMPRPAGLLLGKRPVTHCTGSWVGPRAGMELCGKSRLYWNSAPEPFNT
jgi:hypothetical protein